MNTLSLLKFSSIEDINSTIYKFKQKHSIVLGNLILVNDSILHSYEAGALSYFMDSENLYLFLEHEKYIECQYLTSKEALLSFDLNKPILFNELIDLRREPEDRKKYLLDLYTKADYRYYAFNIEMQVSLDALDLNHHHLILEKQLCVRKCTLEDKDIIFDNINSHIDLFSSFETQLDYEEDIKKGVFYKLEFEDEILCFMRCKQLNRTIAEISKLVTVPIHRKQGYARIFVSEVLLLLEDVNKVVLWVNEENKAALKLYEKLGYKRHRKACMQFIKKVND